MQTSKVITEASIEEILTAVYKEGKPVAYQVDSEFGKELRQFNSAGELDDEIQRLLDAETPFFLFALYYPEAAGFVEVRKIHLKPEKSNGHTRRFSIRGWGLVYVQFTKKHNTLECRVAVNTKKRANGWKETNPKMQDPRLWQWKVVERNAGRIFRSVTKITQAAPADATQTCIAEH
jgi:hypothetical protein